MIPRWIIWVILSLVVRLFLAMILELGNDEVYYATYARYPDWSHFDHPGMMGWLTTLLTVGEAHPSDLALRLLPLLCGTLNGVLVFALAKQIHNTRAATHALVLYTASFCGSVIAGVFLMPDAPQSTFWLAALLLALRHLPGAVRPTWGVWTALGLCIAGALMSKYHSLFLLLGIWCFVVFHARQHLAHVGFWWMNALAAAGMLPTLLWNQSNSWISFAFHTERVNPSAGLRLDFFAQEILGELGYQNPFVWFLTWAAVILAVRRRSRVWRSPKVAMLLLTAVPLLAVFIGFSLFRRTLPHWTGPAYLTLLPLAGVLAAEWGRRGQRLVNFAVGCFALVVIVGTLHIRTGLLTPQAEVQDAPADVTLDLYGWSQAGDLWTAFADSSGLRPDQTVLCSPSWFPTAHIRHYLAARTGAQTLALGPLNEVHKFAWIHAAEGLPSEESRCFLVTDSRNFQKAERWRAQHLPDTPWRSIGTIHRSGRPIKELFVLEMNRSPAPWITTVPAMNR